MIAYRRTSGPRLPRFRAEATGIWPTWPSLIAQLVLSLVYISGAVYVFVLKPRLARRSATPRVTGGRVAPVA